jgi:hypothetical protein
MTHIESQVPSPHFQQIYSKYLNLIKVVIPKLKLMREVYIHPLIKNIKLMKKRSDFMKRLSSMNLQFDLVNSFLNPMTYLIQYIIIGRRDIVKKLINIAKYIELCLHCGVMVDSNEQRMRDQFENTKHPVDTENTEEIIQLWFKNDSIHQIMTKCCQLFENK